MSDETLETRWLALAEKAAGGSLDTLLYRTPDGLTIRPLYLRRPDDGPRLWRASGPWRVSQRVDHPDAGIANRLALFDLEGGADALTLVIGGSPYARGFGLPSDRANLDLALQSIDLDFIQLRLDAGQECVATAHALGQIIEERRLTSAGLDIDLGFDPIGVAARLGTAPDLGPLRRLLDVHHEAGLAGAPLLADSRPYHEAGAGPAQELAACLATAVGYLRALEGNSIGLDDARTLIAVLLVADANSFLSLAKFRAIRRLWARVESSCGLTPKPLRVHAETAWRTMTLYDVWMNAMRATAGIFAAGLGGADIVTALPFTLARGLPDDGARRLARNAQRVLIDESHLDAVDDPSGGAGAFETMTKDLCARAWTLFQEIEKDGGIIASLGSGRLQKDISETAENRRIALASLRAGLVGTNRFPNVDEPTVSVLDAPRHSEPSATSSALPSIREAEPFEDLRAGVETLKARPSVFLATLGTPASFGAAASYAANFCAIAGLRTTAAEARGMEKTTAAFMQNSTRVACICAPSGDQDGAARLAAALREADAALILHVGAPGGNEVALRAAGIDAFIHDGCDALATLAKVVEAASSSSP